MRLRRRAPRARRRSDSGPRLAAKGAPAATAITMRSEEAPPLVALSGTSGLAHRLVPVRAAPACLPEGRVHVRSLRHRASRVVWRCRGSASYNELVTTIIERDRHGGGVAHGATACWPSAEQGPALRAGPVRLDAPDRPTPGQDEAKTDRWRRRSTEKAHAHAPSSIGWRYKNASGVRQDRVDALLTYRWAADHGDSWGREQLARLRSTQRWPVAPRSETPAVPAPGTLRRVDPAAGWAG